MKTLKTLPNEWQLNLIGLNKLSPVIVGKDALVSNGVRVDAVVIVQRCAQVYRCDCCRDTINRATPSVNWKDRGIVLKRYCVECYKRNF